jgi:HD-GYP domain-containing protein (c-di-GMP phosphodiesterase class II)
MKCEINKDTPLYSSRIINSFLKLIKHSYTYIDISDLLSHAKMELYQVEDEGHWFTQEQVDLFYEGLTKATGNDNIAREAGRYVASPDAIGVMRSVILGHVDPATVYGLFEKGAQSFTKSSIHQSRKIGSTKVEIVVTPREGVTEKPYQCENRLGIIDGLALMFNYRLPKIEHPECMFKEHGKVCRYIVSWQESRAVWWRKLSVVAGLVFILASVFSHLVRPQITFTIIVPLATLIFILMVLYSYMVDKQELRSAMDILWQSSDKLVEQVNINYNNALMINEIGFALNKRLDVEDILSNIVQILENRLDFDRGMILLANKERTRLLFCNGFGYTPDQLAILKHTAFDLEKAESKGAFVVSFRQQEPLLINDIDDIKHNLSSKSLGFAVRMGTKSFVCCPIVYENVSLGILVADNVRTKRPLIQSDVSLLMGIAPQIGISIHNAMLVEARERQFKSILHALAASIDARDPLTAGHSERVTEYSVGICEELGLSKDYTEMIKVASLLHDYGKIGISDSVLKKNGPLTAEERREIETHVEKTRKILERINFEGIYQKVPEIAGCHHEKYDGSGYPNGLAGEEIPLGARIIAVADVFEAITAKRHYREPAPFDTAIEMIRESRGRHFDAELVDVFLRFLGKKKLVDQQSHAESVKVK